MAQRGMMPNDDDIMLPSWLIDSSNLFFFLHVEAVLGANEINKRTTMVMVDGEQSNNHLHYAVQSTVAFHEAKQS